MAMQEFLASYAVKVDEEGARRLRDLLASNREEADSAAASFRGAGEALASLFSGGLNGIGTGSGPGGGAANQDWRTALREWKAGADAVTSAYAPLQSLLQRPAGEGNPIQSLLSSLREAQVISLDVDTTAGEESASFFTARMEALRPKLSVNPTGITTAVSGAVSSVRTMLSSLQIAVPVKVRLQADGSQLPGAPAVPGMATGARVERPTLAVIGEGASPEYVIPTRGGQTVPLLKSLLEEMAAPDRAALMKDLGNAASADPCPARPASADPIFAQPASAGSIFARPASADPGSAPSGNPASVDIPASAGFPDISAILTSLIPGRPASGRTETYEDAPLPEADPSPRSSLNGSSLLAQLSGLFAGRNVVSPAFSGSPASGTPVTGSPAPAVFPALSEWLSSGRPERNTAAPLPGADSSLRSRLNPLMLSDRLSRSSAWLNGLAGHAALPDLSSLSGDLAALTAAARPGLFPGMAAGPSAGGSRSIEAPITIQVQAPAASPEAVGRSVYDLAQRHLLRTMERVFR